MAICPLGHVLCPLSGDGRLSEFQRLKMYYFYGEVNGGMWFICSMESDHNIISESE